MFPVTNPKNRNEIFRVQIVLECRQKAGTYGIGQETVGAAGCAASKNGLEYEKLDRAHNNNRLEWYTRDNSNIIVCGLLIRIIKCDTNYDKMISPTRSGGSPLELDESDSDSYDDYTRNRGSRAFNRISDINTRIFDPNDRNNGISTSSYEYTHQRRMARKNACFFE